MIDSAFAQAFLGVVGFNVVHARLHSVEFRLGLIFGMIT